MASSSITANILMKKGKRGAADYVHANPQHLNELLDLILNPKKSIDEWDTIDWIKWLMAGGKTPDEFTSIVLRYDNSMTCGLVWTANYVAYRCRTCGISPCMSLCAQCFQKGNHTGHDFNMFKSQAGGACDCGDVSVMKETGFCERHGPKATVNKPPAPENLMSIAEGIMPRIILRLIQHLRDNSVDASQDAVLLAVQDADAFLTMLHDLSAMGAAMRRVMTGALTNPQLYKHLTTCSADKSADHVRYMTDSARVYNEALLSVPNPEPPEEYKDCPALQELLIHRTFLEELVFWTVKFEFPQKMVCLLLNMLPDPDYKVALTQAFVLHYSRISMMLERSTDPDTLSNRVVHVSVQLFSNESLAFRMAENLNLLHVMVISLKYMMSKILVPNILNNPSSNFHFVVDCSRQVMKEHCYWPLVSDLNNVLSHRPVAVKFMSDDNLLEMWFAFLSMFQGMNVNQRELTTHVEFEPNTYYAAFSAELEASAYPMWAMVSHLGEASSVELTKRVLRSCLVALQDWLDAINFPQSQESSGSQVSFHLPLHRYLAVLTCQAVKTQGVSLKEVLPNSDMLQLIMMHPLRVQVAFYEILSGMWVRNGLQIKGQAMTYIQCNFCNSMVDADLYLLQLCATQLPPDSFLNTVVDKFHVKDWMSITQSPPSSNTFSDTEHDTPMLESCLTFLATLMCIRTNLGEVDASSQLEMVTLLCMGDKTHSQLIELMPERCGTAQSRDFESVLAEVAQYKAPNLDASGNMQQGMYVPTAHVWEQLYDPIHVLLRAVHRRDFQTSMDRFTEYVNACGKVKPGGGAPWPPFRPPAPCHPAYEDPRRLLRSRVFHAIAFLVLHKAVHSQSVSEHVMALTVYLLEMAVVTAEPADQHTQMCATSTRSERHIKDKDLASWYESDWLSSNLRTVINFVKLEPEPAIVFDSSDSDSEWVTVEPTFTMGRALNSDDADIVPMPTPPANLSYEMVPVGQYFSSSASSSNQTTPTTANAADMDQQMVVSEASAEQEMVVSEAGSSQPAGTELVATGSGAGPSSAGSQEMVASTAAGPLTPTTQLASLYRQLAVRRPARGPEGPKHRSKGFHKKRRQVTFDSDSNTLWSTERLEVQESIISLLLKLHSHLSGQPDSFVPDEPEAQPDESRIGDGRFFVAKVLNRICQLDTLCREEIGAQRDRLWPRKQEECEEEQKEQEAKEREERRRRAKDRQQKLMAEFASKQKLFMERAMETDEEGARMEWSEDGTSPSTPLLASKVEYDCVICNQTTPSTPDKPMGLAVLVQPTSVLGHRRRAETSSELPTDDEGARRLRAEERLAAEFDRRLEELGAQFDSLSWQLSLSLGWEGGVYLQTCGHHLHLDCLKSYLHSLRGQQRNQSIAVDRGEYWCPLCRQLANSVLPLSPLLGECAAVVRSRPASQPAIVNELANFLKENPPSPVVSNVSEAMAKCMEEMTECTHIKYKQKSAQPSPQSLFLFVSSIARTNLEVELVQRGGTLCCAGDAGTSTDQALLPKRSCIVPLLHVLAMHARFLACWPAWRTLLTIAGVTADVDAPLALAALEHSVPLLLSDPTALLVQFVLLLPLHLDQTYFSCLVKLLYNLLYLQVTAQLSCQLTEAERVTYRGNTTASVTSLDSALALTIGRLDQSQLYLEDDSSVPMEAGARRSRRELELEVQRLCLPYLRVAALLRRHLYEQPLPEVVSPQSEFVRLVYYLELVTEGMDWQRFSAAVALNWAADGVTTATTWLDECAVFVNRCQVGARSFLVDQHITWHQPRLLRLPQLYDRIFQYYHEKQCQHCHSVPRETSICLLCGALVCLKENCCKQNNVCEAVQHSVDCGGGTAVYLVVTSSYVIVVRGKRACLWGSVYLDTFGEEDRELKRGKPLELSAGRYQLLEQQWLAHRFDHTNKKWVWHRDAL